LGTLVPVIGLVQVGDQAMADRYTYIPLIGLFLMVAWWIPELLDRWPYRRIVLPVAAGVVLLACTITARSQVRYWKNNLALLGHPLEVTNDNYLAHYNLGVVLIKQGRVKEAIDHYSEAVAIMPSYADAHYNLGIALNRQGRAEEAIVHYSDAIRIQPDF